MQRLVIHQKIGQPGSVRVWLGITGQSAVPPLEWSLDGTRTNPRVVRELSHAFRYQSGSPATITGVLDLGCGLEPGTTHRIDVNLVRNNRILDSASIKAALLPKQLGSEPLSILLGSCFSNRTDHGAVGHVVSEIRPAPALTLLVGDQVYLDPPLLLRFAQGRDQLARMFERQYQENWMRSIDGRKLSGYSRLLNFAPTATIPDDHEFWNNHPNRQPQLPITWTSDGRNAWRDAAMAMYKAFQCIEHDTGNCQFINIDPLSICLLDNRTARDDVPGTSMTYSARTQLVNWVDGVLSKVDGAHQRIIPVLVTGPSLVQPRKSAVGRIADANLANFDDYLLIMDQLRRLLEAGYPVLLLTGDVHYPRISRAVMPDAIASRGGVLTEVISSPISLVQFPGLDQLHQHVSRSGAIAARWPRTKPPKADVIPLHFEQYFPDPHSDSDDTYGDHLAVLTFGPRTTTGVSLRVQYHPIKKGETRGSRLGDMRPTEIPLTWNFIEGNT